MNRTDFIRKSLLGTSLLSASPALANLVENDIDELQPLEVVGFNHLPPAQSAVTPNMILHRATSRGHANHGWLDTSHSFSFANYYNPERMHFGVLRVLNDDFVDGGQGFPTHPHDNMEIISIPLTGDLEHKDSMGHTQVIRQNDVQIMSAGTGIFHSEYNKNPDRTVNFLQIWVFPNRKGLTPRYDQQTFWPEQHRNKLVPIVSPVGDSHGIDIHQDAWFSLGTLDKNVTTRYTVRKRGNGVYCFVIDGSVTIAGQLLNRRDALGIWDVDTLHITPTATTQLLLIDVPMALS